MSYDAQVQPGEIIQYHGQFQKNKNADPFAITVTDKAVYIPRKKSFAISDPYYFERWCKEDVLNWRVEKIKPFGMYVLGSVITVLGLLCSWLMFEIIYTNGQGTLAVAPLFLIGLGLTIFLSASSRMTISIITSEKKFRWKYPMSISNEQKKYLESMFLSIGSALISQSFKTDSLEMHLKNNVGNN